MSRSELFGLRPIGRRGTVILATIVASAAMFFAVAAGPVPNAYATYGSNTFCYYNAAPYGQSGDRCYSEAAHWLVLVQSYGYSYGSCGDAWKDGLVTYWACAPANVWSSNSFDGSRYMLGVVRNNATCCINRLWGNMGYNI